MTCRFSHLDGSYVLGALSPAERAAYQRHLPDCAECTRAVDELAGLPTLLARVPVGDPHRPGAGPPPTLLPALVRQVRLSTRRRTAAVAAVAAAGGAVLALATLSISSALDRDAATTAAGPTATPSSSLPSATGARRLTTGDGGPVTADVALTGVPWGTRLDLVCTWRPGADVGGDGGAPATDAAGAGAPAAEVYVLVVRTRGGALEQVGTWHPLPDRTMRLSAGTAVPVQDITAVEVHEDGELVATLAG